MSKIFNLISIIIIAALLFVIGMCWFFGNTLETNTRTRIDSALLQSEIRDIAELSTIVYAYESVASLDRYVAGRLFGREWRWPGTTRSLLIRYNGEVRFGVDFDRIIIDVDNITNSITVLMPPSRIMTHSIDFNTVHVFDDSAGIFVQRSVYDTTDTIANEQAQKEEMLINAGMLDQASENAENLIRRFIESIVNQHDEEFEIIFR